MLQWQARSHCRITSLRFFIGLKSAHTDRFFVVSSSEKKSDRFFIGPKVSAHEPIFTPTTTNQSQGAGHNRHENDCSEAFQTILVVIDCVFTPRVYKLISQRIRQTLFDCCHYTEVVRQTQKLCRHLADIFSRQASQGRHRS